MKREKKYDRKDTGKIKETTEHYTNRKRKPKAQRKETQLKRENQKNKGKRHN